MTEDASHVVAFIDIGTNAVRLLLVRVTPAHSYKVLMQQREAVRLGEGEFRNQMLQADAMERALLVCRKFADLARSHAAKEIVAVATSATREARNQQEFVRRLEAEAGLTVHVISGIEEARLIYLGVASGIHLDKRTALFVDIGGGSTEISVGDQQQFQWLESLKLGAIRLTSLYIPHPEKPLSRERYDAMREHIRSVAVRTFQRVRLSAAVMAVGSSGSIANLADIAARIYLKRRRERDDVLTLEQLQGVVALLRPLTQDKRKEVPGINPERADIILAGAAIIETILQETRLSAIHISERGLRDGLLMDYLARIDPTRALTQMPVRMRSVMQLGRACHFEEKHARQVADLALMLFDSAKELGLHWLGAAERELLEYAALLHDIGTFVSYENHHAHSHYLIRNADLLGFDQQELACMAATAYFHRRTLARRKHPLFEPLDSRSKRAVPALSMLLRMAESLDRSHAGKITRVSFERVPQDGILLTMEAPQDCELEVWGVRHHLDAFKKTFEQALEIRVMPTHARVS
ncbi:MAG TPA: Ppx/GppA phosphatase family protein [bacterium]|jgi:exopolyphosphatase/guanosine-5'-triphosphate,3'-diphosphate pyrophosphatase